MTGAIIGDIVGSRFEFANYKGTDFELFTEENTFTDDTVMTAALAKTFLEEMPENRRLGFSFKRALVSNMKTFGKKYPNRGYGGRFQTWLQTASLNPYYSYGNGSAMRTAPVGLVAETEEEAMEFSRACAEVTHNHPQGIIGAQAISLCIFWARKGWSKEQIRCGIRERFGEQSKHYETGQDLLRDIHPDYNLEFTLDEIREDYEFNETCQGSCPEAIEAFLESTSFEDAIRKAISIGGDSDTIAAMTGAIAEAFYGVSEEIKNKARTYLSEEMNGILDMFLSFLYQEAQGRKRDLTLL